jgi:hypothetical protein
MKDIIKKILTEEKQKVDLTSTISSMGLFSFLETVGLSYDEIVEQYGDGFLNRDVMVNFIKEFVDYYYGKNIGTEINPILISNDDDTLKQIEFVTSDYVIVVEYKIFVFDEWMEHSSEYDLSYGDLDDYIISELFVIFMDIYEHSEK